MNTNESRVMVAPAAALDNLARTVDQFGWTSANQPLLPEADEHHGGGQEARRRTTAASGPTRRSFTAL